MVGGSAAQLDFTATDGSNNAVAVTPGSALWSVVSGSTHLSVTTDGIATPMSAGTAVVTAKVDGVVSAQARIQVSSPSTLDFGNSGFEAPSIPASSYIEQGASIPYWTAPTVQSGWTDTGFGIANGRGSWGTGAEAGAQYAFLQTANQNVDTDQGSCTQTLTGLTIGGTYEVTFWLAARNGNVGGNTPIAPVFLTANSNTIFPATAPPSVAWKQYTSSQFVATASSYTFTFGTNPAPSGVNMSSLLDEVHLVRVN